MQPETADAGFEVRKGVREFVLVAFPVAMFGVMFGAASSAAGYSVGVTVWSSAAIFAGASQFVFLDVYRQGIPVWSVALAVFAVNFRHILYSAALARKIAHFSFVQKTAALFLLTDLQFAIVEKRYEAERGRWRVAPAFYFAFGICSYCLWLVTTGLGAVFGALIEDPAVIGFDFVLPIYFLSILMGFRARRSFLPVVVVSAAAALLAQKWFGPPWHISLGGICGILAAGILTAIRGDKPVEIGDAMMQPPGGEGADNG
ncbi:MAG: AzlC family ABC transporter permease [Nitratireductor sp.]|nr:AzlC family ABC transporter permease [Nitratireductor sp.]